MASFRRQAQCGAITLYDVRHLLPGDCVVGKWNGTKLFIERKLGEGANGSVYLARSTSGSSPCALKLGTDYYGLQSEVNALRALSSLAKHGMKVNVPRLYETDDWECVGAGISAPYYTMTYVPGLPITQAITGQGIPPIHEYGHKLLSIIGRLHQCGWAFCDLKAANVLVSTGGEPWLIDFGGATSFGRAVKQYSELYDRGFWKAGERIADPSYDLFSFAVLMLEAAGGGSRLLELSKHTSRRNKEWLAAMVDEYKSLYKVAACLKSMIRGEYASVSQAVQDWRRAAAGKDSRQAAAADWCVYWFSGSAAAFAVSVCWAALK